MGLRSGCKFGKILLNLDFQNNQINLFNRPGSKDLPPFKLKDHESRTVKMPNWVAALLLELYEQIDPGCPFLFLAKKRFDLVKANWTKIRNAGLAREWKNRQFQNNTLRNFLRYCSNAGIKTNDRLTLHCLRKSWACNLAENGVPLQTLLKMGGWFDIQTVQKFYLKNTDENEKRAVNILDNLMA